MEKTFEELVKQNCIEIDWIPNIYIPIGRVEALMQQVREATIAECADIELDSCSSVETQKRFDNLQTDRILTP